MGFAVKRVSFDDVYLYMMINGTKYRVSMMSLSLRLFRADKNCRENFRVSAEGFTIYWPKLDLEVQMTGLLQMAQKTF
jgi:Protein of unknown function (DUF2442)